MEDLRNRVDELAELMDEFKLAQAELSGDGWRVAFRKRSAAKAVAAPMVESGASEPESEPVELAPPVPAAPQGTPVSSPMNGIFYAAPSPSAPPFVREGEPVTAGEVVALIEAMKVFNEITAPTSGTVLKIVAASGQIVNPGDPLLYIG